MNVEVFTTPTCEDCRNFKKFLSEHHILFTEFNIAVHPEHADTLFNRTGKRLVP
ncbi:MAG TPA: NrdH-redoxin, partial [Paenibacillus sp.]|nr:NrdH-redoxin [Paenibacillus sp.]